MAPDLLITDMARGGLNGWKMLPLLARRKVEFPILVVSGTASEEGVREFAGPELNISFMNLPPDLELLKNFLENVLKVRRSA